MAKPIDSTDCQIAERPPDRHPEGIGAAVVGRGQIGAGLIHAFEILKEARRHASHTFCPNGWISIRRGPSAV